MRKLFRFVLLPLLIIAVIVVSYIKLALPNVGDPEDIKFEYTAERVEHGKYLANAVAVCMDCHSKRDWTVFTGPIMEGTFGAGGEYFGPEMGFPGKFYSKNITPAGIGEWTDGELLRAITTGVSRDGSPLFPVMPYHVYGKMDKEDVLDIIAYLRSLPAIKNEVPSSSANFPMNIIMHTIPQKASFQAKPDTSDKVAYGKYVFGMAGCAECHTKQEKGKPVAGMELAGGFEFNFPDGTVIRSSNLTTDEETGIMHFFDEKNFVGRFKRFSSKLYIDRKVKDGSLKTVMPWKMYANMKEEDLKAIFAYLKTVPPVKNQVQKFTPVKK